MTTPTTNSFFHYDQVRLCSPGFTEAVSLKSVVGQCHSCCCWPRERFFTLERERNLERHFYWCFVNSSFFSIFLFEQVSCQTVQNQLVVIAGIPFGSSMMQTDDPYMFMRGNESFSPNVFPDPKSTTAPASTSTTTPSNPGIVPLDKKPFKCSHCSKAFLYSSSLTAHEMMMHRSDLPYECRDCGRRFSLNTHLERHQMIHTGAEGGHLTKRQKREFGVNEARNATPKRPCRDGTLPRWWYKASRSLWQLTEVCMTLCTQHAPTRLWRLLRLGSRAKRLCLIN